MTPREAVLRQLEGLSRAYRTHLPVLLTRLAQDIEDALAADESACWLAVRHQAHQMAGNAGIFGLSAIGALGGALELAADRRLAGDWPADAPSQVRQTLASLASEVSLLAGIDEREETEAATYLALHPGPLLTQH